MDKKIKKKYIKRLKEILEINKGDNELIHCEYDELLEDLIREIGYGKLMDKLKEMVSDIAFWYA